MHDLTRDEAKLLAVYYLSLHDVTDFQPYEKERLFPTLESWRKLATIPFYGENQAPDIPKFDSDQSLSRWHRLTRRVDKANLMLNERGLVKLTPHENVSNVFVIRLTTEGNDLGRKYSTWQGRLDEWYRSHREGVVGVVIALLAGTIGGFISHWLTNEPMP